VSRRTVAVVGVAVAVLLLATTALALPGVVERPRKAGLSVTQRGAVSGLYPGRSTTATVVVRNTSTKPVKVRSVTARPQSAPGCPASMLRVGRASAPKVLKPRRSVVVRLPVELSRSAPDTCQGRSFRLVLKATGTATR
jgi:hypothetical protein